MKTCTNSSCTQHNRPIAVKKVRFCPTCGESVQAPSKRRWLSTLILAIGSVLALFILLLVTSGLGGLGGMAISPPETEPALVSGSAPIAPISNRHKQNKEKSVRPDSTHPYRPGPLSGTR